MKSLKFHWWALAVLLLAAGFRLVLLHDVPPGLAQDEVLNADIVTYIRQGQHALFFREGYGHEPLYHYWSVPFQVLFGDNVLSIRLPAVYLGLLLVALTLRWVQREFGGVTAVTAGLGLAVSWWPIIFSRVGLRPILEPLLLVAAAWFWRRPWLAGLFLGLSLYSYTGARVIFLLPVLWGVVQFMTAPDKSGRQVQVKTAVIILTVTLLVYLPLYLTLRADPSLQQRVDQLAGPLDALRQGEFGPIWQMTVATLGVFSFTGDPRWTYSPPGRPFFDGVTAVFFYGGCLLAIWRWRQPRYSLVLVWLVVGLLPSAITPQAPSTVRLVGAMPVVYLLVGTAVSAFIQWVQSARPTVKRYVWPGAAVFLLVVGLVNVFRTVNDGFLHWPAALETRLKYQTVLLDMSRYYKERPSGSLVVADGFYEPIDRDSFRRNLGYDPMSRWIQTGAQVAGAIVLPYEGEGGNGRFYVPEFAPIDPALLAAAGISDKPIYRSEQQPSFAVYKLPTSSIGPKLANPIVFDGMITLEGYEIIPLEAGQTSSIMTVWRVERALPEDLTSFIHLLDVDGNIIAQYDGFDAAPAELQPGDRIIQRYFMVVPEVSGPMTLQLGLYTLDNQARLRHDGVPDDVVILARNLFVDGK